MREPNEIDFWRGFALLTIFVNHIPGNFFERFTFRNISISDSAELFVFLAGWAMRKLIDGPARSLSGKWLMFRLGGRALTVYFAQTVITGLAIALLAGASLLLDAPFLLDWHNASAVFNDPVKAHIGLVLLTHQLGYFDILPLYFVLMLVAPLVALAHRHARPILPLISVAIYVYALTFGVNFPTWPVEGVWFFNPLAWQLIYVLGFFWRATTASAPSRGASQNAAGARCPDRAAWNDRRADRFLARSDRRSRSQAFFLFDKSFLSPARLIHSLALTALFAGSFKTGHHLAAAYFEISKSARAKFAQCILRRVAFKPDRTDKPLRVWRTCCNRRGDNYHWRPRDGIGRMGIGMARETANDLARASDSLSPSSLSWLSRPARRKPRVRPRRRR